MIEFFHASGFVSFDGRVLESWSNSSSYTGRLHVAVIREVRIRTGMLSRQRVVEVQTIYGAGNFMFPIGDEHHAKVEQLIAAVHAAKEEVERSP